MKAAFTQNQAHGKPDGSALGVFALLVVITIMPKEMGHLICVVLGAGFYLLFLTFQPSIQSLPSEKDRVVTEPLPNKNVSTPQCDRVTPSPKLRSKAVPMNTDATKIPEHDVIQDDDDDGTDSEVSNAKDSSDELTEEDFEDSKKISAEEVQCIQQQMPTNCKSNLIKPQHDEQRPEQLLKLKEDLKHFFNNQQQDSKKTLKESTKAVEIRTEVAPVHADIAALEMTCNTKSVTSLQMPMIGLNWIEDTNTMLHANSPMIDQFCNQVCGMEMGSFLQPVCMSDNLLPTAVSAETLNPQKSQDCWNWVERGWCPRGAACRWEHPREKEDSNIFWANIQSAGGSNFDASCDNTSDANVVKTQSTDFDVGNMQNFKHNQVSASDDDGYMTDDGF